jgi:Hint domain
MWRFSRNRRPTSRARRHFLGVAATASAKVVTASVAALSALSSPANAKNDRGKGHAYGKGHGSGNPHGDVGHCFLRGTSILTPTGEVRVEELSIGDLVETVRGTAAPVKWIGHRSYKTCGSSWHKSVMPICVRRHSLFERTPLRDLYLSPRHSLLIDGVLIQVQDLVNGLSIAPALPVGIETIEYFHIVLDSHEVVLADGAPVETCLVSERDYESFSNFGEYERLYGPETPPAMVPFAPMIASGGRAHVKALLRLGVARFIGMSNPLDEAYDRITRRATELLDG